jgi:ribonuclease-3
MNGSPITFFDKIKALCLEHGNETIWDLAVTHASAHPAPTAQLALSQLGKLALEFVLTWNHIRLHEKRDSGTITAQVNAFMSSASWANALICDETLSVFKTAQRLNAQTLSLLNKKHFVLATLGACFYLDSVKGAKVVLDELLCFHSPVDSDAFNPKSRLQQYAQSIKGTAPTYAVISEEGPDHDKRFLVKVQIPGTSRSAAGRGTNKKAAEKDAAACLLRLCGVSFAQPASARPVPRSAPSRLDETGIAAWRLSRQVDRRLRINHLQSRATRFVTFFRQHTGIQLPPDPAEIAVTHSSLDAELSDTSGPKGYGLTLLGNRAYLYAVASALFRELDLNELSAPDLRGRIGFAIFTVATHPYKARLAQPWSVYIHASKHVPRPLPESVLLDAFDGSLGAAVLLDLANVDTLAIYLREQLDTHVNVSTASVDSSISKEVRNLAKTQLQHLWQICFPKEKPFLDTLFTFHIAGPRHSEQFTCQIIGDLQNQFSGVAATKAAAQKVACDKALAFICRHVSVGNAIPSGVVWIDSLVNSMRDNLLDQPTEAMWLAVRFEEFPFPWREFWTAVRAAVFDPVGGYVTGLQAIQQNSDLSGSQKHRLSTFLADRFAERTAARPIRVVEMSLNGLLEKQKKPTAAHAISIVSSGLHLLKFLERHTRRWVTVADIVTHALSLLAPSAQLKILVPVKLAHIEIEGYLTVLQQLRASQCACGRIAVAVVEESLVISGELSGSGVMDHGPLFAATWASCDGSVRGFTACGSSAGFNIKIPLKGEVYVTTDGVCDEDTQRSIGALGPVGHLGPEAEGARSALHEVKNRMIASPERCMEEISGCAKNLTKMAEIMRTPHLERVALHRVCEIIRDAVTNAGATYGTAGEVDLIHEDDVGYVDVAMVATIFTNLADNASRAAGEVEKGAWRVEGIITASEIDVSVWNTCRDVAAAKLNVGAVGGHASSILGTGIGVATIKRLAGKLLGTVAYQFEEWQVCATVVLPLDLARVSWILGERDFLQ